jgi:ribosomal peptide maturation radical SAM protein 1
MTLNGTVKEVELHNLRILSDITRPASVDVLFAVMPYISVEHPALGPSILKSCLVNRGIKAKINYFVFEFAELLGPDLYQRINVSDPTALIAEWTFCEAAFGSEFDQLMTQKYGRYPRWTIYGDELDSGFNDVELEEARLNANIWIRNVIETISSDPPKILVCSSMFQQNMASLAVLRGVKERLPEVITIIGGANTEGILGIGLLRRAPWLDYVCSGEGEETLPELCQKLLVRNDLSRLPVGVTSQQDVERFAGLFNSEIPRAVLSDLSQSPIPCFDDFFQSLEKSQLIIRPGLVLESSRGCWWGQKKHCTFCGLNGEGMAYRTKSPQQTLAEVKKLTTKHGVKTIAFADNIISLSAFKNLLPLLEKESLIMFYETKANLNEEQVRAFQKSGVRFIQPGIESLIDEVLMLMRKGTSAATNLECLRLCREYGINASWSILAGFPGEKEEWYLDLANLLPKLFHLVPPLGLVPIRFDRFSPYFENPSNWGLELTPYENYNRVYPQYLDQNSDIAYYFESNSSYLRVFKYGLAPALKMCSDIVIEWQRNWRQEFIDYGKRPTLLMEDLNGNEINIVDTRRGTANVIRTAIDAKMRDVLLVCRSRHPKSSLWYKFAVEGYPSKMCPNELEQVLSEAISYGWIAEVSGSYISLVQIYNPTHPGMSHSPSGLLKGKQVGKTIAKTSIC